MDYQALIRRLFSVNLFGGMKLGLTNCYQLQNLLNFPDKAFQTIHIAGTNGKGSVATKIAQTLQESGYRVGLYTSPHLSSFRERIRINQEMISKSAVESLLTHLFDLTATHDIPATFFELATLLALTYFAKEQVDVAVLETGLGGRLDATNIVSPLLSIITSISLDHTEILGSTEEAIAKEKAGIIKSGIPVIIGPRTPYRQLLEMACAKNSPCIKVQCPSSLFEDENKAIACTALNHLKNTFKLSSEALTKGLEARPPCRFEVLSGSPTVILDVAHNPDGLHRLFQSMHMHFPQKPVRALFGLSKGKDLDGCLKILKNHAAAFHLVEASNGRGAAIDDLKARLLQLGEESSHIHTHPTIEGGVHIATQTAKLHGQILLICGSFFIMSQARQALGIHEPHDEVDLNERHGQVPI